MTRLMAGFVGLAVGSILGLLSEHSGLIERARTAVVAGVSETPQTLLCPPSPLKECMSPTVSSASWVCYYGHYSKQRGTIIEPCPVASPMKTPPRKHVGVSMVIPEGSAAQGGFHGDAHFLFSSPDGPINYRGRWIIALPSLSPTHTLSPPLKGTVGEVVFNADDSDAYWWKLAKQARQHSEEADWLGVLCGNVSCFAVAPGFVDKMQRRMWAQDVVFCPPSPMDYCRNGTPESSRSPKSTFRTTTNEDPVMKQRTYIGTDSHDPDVFVCSPYSSKISPDSCIIIGTEPPSEIAQ